MKSVKRVALLSLITVVFSLVLAGMPVLAAADLSATLQSPLQGAVLLAEKMRAGETRFSVPAAKNFDFEQMHYYLKMLYPEYYALSWTVRSGKADIEVLHPKPEQLAEVRALAQTLVAEQITDEMTVAEKLLILHNIVADRCAYDYDAALNLNITGDEPFTAYGALVTGKAVCDGYVAAFSLLCDVAGIDNLAIISEEMNHSWNAVLCDGQVWYVDVTYNDTDGLTKQGATDAVLEYFMVPEEHLAATHAWDRKDAQTVIDTVWPQEYRAARALYDAGLFAGSDKGFELDRTPMRFEAALLLARLTGLEEGAGAHPFTDVADFYSGALGALYEQGLIKGVTETLFAPNEPVTARQYLTLALRGLGYAEGSDFTYATALDDAVTLGILSREESVTQAEKAFTRGDMALITYRMMALLNAAP